MKANELRLGNHINYEFKKDSGNKKEILVTVQDIKYIETQSMFYYTPIPLTREWLLGLGFEHYSNNEYEIRSEGVSFNWDRVYGLVVFLENSIESISLEHIKYVHQLQNLYFLLTDNELKYK
jgi:hypothetical protein